MIASLDVSAMIKSTEYRIVYVAFRCCWRLIRQ